MKKRFFPVLFLISLFFASCGLNEVLVADIDGIRSSIQLTYEFTDTGATFSWTKPKHLDTHAEKYLISENDSSSSTSSITCLVVDSIYRDSSYYDETSIKKSCSSVDFDYRPTGEYYLWVAIDNTRYNLGLFRPVSKTLIEPIKKQIKLNVDDSDTNDLKFQWAIPSALSINPRRFIITEDSSTNYSDPYHTFTCLIIKDFYRETLYEDQVSIKRNYSEIQNGYILYNVEASTTTPQNYYLWIQIEDGTWYNLGKFNALPNTNPSNNSPIDSIRQNIKLSYKFTKDGTVLTWTKPSGLDSMAKCFVISENSNDQTIDGLTGKVVDSIYRNTNYDDQISIKPSLNSVTLGWYVKTSPALYLWFEDTSGTCYNLGKFTTPSTNISNVKSNITIDGDIFSLGYFDHNGLVVWMIPESITLNAMRFVIAKDSSTKYAATSSSGPTSCRKPETEYLDLISGDYVSIKSDCYETESGYNLYQIYLIDELTTGYYLWVQIEDGSWWNLGQIQY